MKYLLMIYENEKLWEQMSEREQATVHQEYGALEAPLRQAGAFLAGEALLPTATATTVRIRDGKRLTTDGPFAETKEQLGGFFLIEARNIDEAIAIASRIPTARTGSIEVRPCMEIPAA